MAHLLVKCTLLCVVLLICVDNINGGGAITSNLWVNIPTPDNPPSARYAHTAVYNPVNKSMVIFGGLNSTMAGNDIDTYTVDTDEWETYVKTTGTTPRARYGHTAVATGLNTMVVFGGRYNSTLLLNDVAVFDMVANKWLSVKITGTPPSPRAYHTAVVDRYQHVMYVYGGATGAEGSESTTAQSDLYTLSFDTPESFSWSRVQTNGSAPVARAFHSALMTQQGVMVAFGGIGLSDVACFSVRNDSWYSCLTDASPAPSVRYGHTAVFSPLQYMVIYGGRNSAGNPVSDVWNFDLTEFKWEVVNPGGVAINPRAFHAAIATPFGSMIVFGGIDGDGLITDDFGLYNLANTVLKSANDGVVLVVIVTLMGTILLSMCFAMDYMQEQNAIEKDEALAKAAAESKKNDHELLLPKLPQIPKALQIPLGPRAQKFFDEFKMSLDPMHDPPK